MNQQKNAYDNSKVYILYDRNEDGYLKILPEILLGLRKLQYQEAKTLLQGDLGQYKNLILNFSMLPDFYETEHICDNTTKIFANKKNAVIVDIVHTIIDPNLKDVLRSLRALHYFHPTEINQLICESSIRGISDRCQNILLQSKNEIENFEYFETEQIANYLIYLLVYSNDSELILNLISADLLKINGDGILMCENGNRYFLTHPSLLSTAIDFSIRNNDCRIIKALVHAGLSVDFKGLFQYRRLPKRWTNDIPREEKCSLIEYALKQVDSNNVGLVKNIITILSCEGNTPPPEILTEQVSNSSRIMPDYPSYKQLYQIVTDQHEYRVREVFTILFQTAEKLPAELLILIIGYITINPKIMGEFKINENRQQFLVSQIKQRTQDLNQHLIQRANHSCAISTDNTTAGATCIVC